MARRQAAHKVRRGFGVFVVSSEFFNAAVTISLYSRWIQIGIFAPGGLLKRLGFAAENGGSDFKKSLNGSATLLVDSRIDSALRVMNETGAKDC
jgi:hypothetical protein